ncbi:MAG: sugar ABC transporter substrate-binding protein [Candidatus Leucobacter sulfamidivorax]|nr:sugar ABC transporter substrate-binding protein [Candidatus Leucobacter sulfamidivorax]
MKKSLMALGVGVAVASLTFLTACSAGTEASAPAEEETVELSPEAQAAADLISQVTKPVDEFVAPGPAVDGSALEGKTVYFIPASLQVPLMGHLAEGVTQALANVGATVQSCDAKANPADAASCVNQAVDAQAAVVVTAGLTPEFAPAAFDALLAAGIPWVQGLTAPAGDLDPAQVGYVTPNIIMLQTWSTNWVIADSDAKANVLVIKMTDTPTTTMWGDVGILGVYDEACSECRVEVIEINTGQLERLPSLVSSALIANPDITYVQSQADSILSGVLQGIQSAARDDVRVVSMDGFLSTMQDLEAGGQVKAVSGFNSDALAWYMSDAAVRLTSDAPAVVPSDFPFRRLFTSDNVRELTITADALESGEWFGKADYQAGFLELWGVN